MFSSSHSADVCLNHLTDTDLCHYYPIIHYLERGMVQDRRLRAWAWDAHLPGFSYGASQPVWLLPPQRCLFTMIPWGRKGTGSLLSLSEMYPLYSQGQNPWDGATSQAYHQMFSSFCSGFHMHLDHSRGYLFTCLILSYYLDFPVMF